VTHLRQIMLEELRRRNFADSTIRSYLHAVEHFSRYFHRRPDQLGPEHIREYQAALFTKLKFSPNTVTLRLAALRFFYIQVLKRGWSIAETPYPKKVLHLPEILSQDEVARLIDAAEFPFHRILLMTLLCHRRTSRRSGTPEDQRYRQPADGRPYPGRQRSQGPRCHAQPQVARCAARLLARAQAQANELAVSRQPVLGRRADAAEEIVGCGDHG
jgi:hypothetical protein